MTLELTPDDIARIKDDASYFGNNPKADILALLRDREKLEAECERLRGALPKTADGVAILPGMTVWVRLFRGSPLIEQMRARSLPVGFDGFPVVNLIAQIDGVERESAFHGSQIYSTEAAASTAKEQA